jgi:hypothetical protein
MFHKVVLGAALAAALIAPLAASAGEVANRIASEQGRIDAGVRNGSLTYGEYSHVESHLDAISAQRRADLARNGGRLTPGDYRRLNREENHLSDRIWFDEHNAAHQP